MRPVCGPPGTGVNWTIEGAFVAGLYYARVANALVHVNGQPIRCSIDLSVTMRY